jgi:hypothetical protein
MSAMLTIADAASRMRCGISAAADKTTESSGVRGKDRGEAAQECIDIDVDPGEGREPSRKLPVTNQANNLW